MVSTGNIVLWNYVSSDDNHFKCIKINVNVEDKSTFTYEDALEFVGHDYALAA